MQRGDWVKVQWCKGGNYPVQREDMWVKVQRSGGNFAGQIGVITAVSFTTPDTNDTNDTNDTMVYAPKAARGKRRRVRM
jgi:hypothetical protein